MGRPAGAARGPSPLATVESRKHGGNKGCMGGLRAAPYSPEDAMPLRAAADQAQPLQPGVAAAALPRGAAQGAARAARACCVHAAMRWRAEQSLAVARGGTVPFGLRRLSGLRPPFWREKCMPTEGLRRLMRAGSCLTRTGAAARRQRDRAPSSPHSHSLPCRDLLSQALPRDRSLPALPPLDQFTQTVPPKCQGAQ